MTKEQQAKAQSKIDHLHRLNNPLVVPDVESRLEIAKVLFQLQDLIRGE